MTLSKHANYHGPEGTPYPPSGDVQGRCGLIPGNRHQYPVLSLLSAIILFTTVTKVIL